MKLIGKYYIEIVKKYPWIFLKSVLMILLITLLNTLIPCGMRIFIESISVRGGAALILAGVMAFAAVMLLNSFFEIRWYVIQDELGGKCIADLTTEIEGALVHASRNDADQVGSSSLKHILYSDMLDIFRVVGHHIPSMIGNIVTVLICLLLSARYSILLTVYITAAAAGGALLSFASRKIIMSRAHRTNAKLKQHHAMCGQFTDSLPQYRPMTCSLLSGENQGKHCGFHHHLPEGRRGGGFWTRLVSNYNVMFSILRVGVSGSPVFRQRGKPDFLYHAFGNYHFPEPGGGTDVPADHQVGGELSQRGPASEPAGCLRRKNAGYRFFPGV